MKKLLLSLSVVIAGCGGGGGSDPIIVVPSMSQYWTIEDTGLVIPNDNAHSDRWFNFFEVADINSDGLEDVVLTGVEVVHGFVGTWTHKTFLPNKPKIILGGQKITSNDAIVPSGTGYSRVVVYDMNGDGKDDILFQDSGPDAGASPGGQNQLVISSSKNHELAELPAMLASTSSSAGGQISGNKVLFMNTMSGEVSVPFLLIYRNGSFVMDRTMLPSFITDTITDPWVPTGKRPIRSFTATAIGDVDGDGIDDLILGQWGPYSSNLLPSGLIDPLATSSIVLGTSSGWSSGRTVKLPNPSRLPPEKVTVLDIKLVNLFGSGKKDIIVVYTDNYKSRGIQILKNNGDGNFTDVSDDALGTSSYNIGKAEFQSRVVDVNGDGCMDIVLPYYKERTDGKAFGEVFLSDCKGRFVDATQAFNTIILELQTKLKNELMIAGGIFLMPLKDYTGRTSFYMLVQDNYSTKNPSGSTHVMKLKNLLNMPTPLNGKIVLKQG